MSPLFLVPVLVNPAAATDRYVCADTATCTHSATCLAGLLPCYATVQGALDASSDGDTLYLSAETYREAVVNDGGPDGLTLIGVDATTTVIEGTANAEGVKFKGVDSTWSGIGFTTPVGVTNRHCAKVENGTASFTEVQFSGCEANHGGGLDVNNATVDIVGSRFVENGALNEGGAHVYVHSGTVTVTDTEFETGSAPSGDGGAIRMLEGDLTLWGCTFLANTTGGVGGAVAAEGDGAVEIVSSTFEGNTSGETGGAVDVRGPALRVDNSLFEANASPFHGGGVYCGVLPQCEVRHSTFRDNSGNYGAALASQTTTGALVESSLFCGNHGPNGNAEGGAILVSAGSMTLTRNGLIENDCGGAGGGLFATDGATITSTNNTWVGNLSGNSGAALWTDANTVTSVNDLFLSNNGQNEVAYETGGTLTVDYGLFFDNAAGDTSGTVGAGMVYADPQLSWTSGSCDPATLVPPPGSPAVDAGDPGMLDPDGSPADIGAWGGPGSDDCLGQAPDSDLDGTGDPCDRCPDVAFEADLDGDGFVTCEDCDDDDGLINPAAQEIVGNLVDEDCDGIAQGAPGGSGTGTGTGAPEVGRTWEEPGLSPEDAGKRPVGCGCSAAPSPLSTGWLVVLLALGARPARRRRGRPVVSARSRTRGRSLPS